MSDAHRVNRTITEADLERLKKQREDADSRYDEALTRLDGALSGIPELPHPPPASGPPRSPSPTRR